jgi:putative ABC transport system permease protein
MWFSSFIVKNLLRRKVRSVLTSTGIAVAIGAMVILLGITHSFEKSSTATFEKHGIDLMVTVGSVVDQLTSDVDMSLQHKIAAIPGVDRVGTALLELVTYQKGGNTISLLVQGWEPGTFPFDGMTILEGRTLHPGDTRSALLGPTLARNLKLKVGDTLAIYDEKFEVVGIAEGVSVFENGSATIPLRELQKLSGRVNRVTGFSVILDKSPGRPDLAEEVRRQIQELTGPNGRPARLNAQPTQEYVKGMMHIRAAGAMAWMTSVVAVLIGAIGMLNTMIMSVLERVREIGILRAVGWRKGRVVRMILGEAVLLSVAGAVLGILGALVLMHFLTRLPAVNGFLTGEIAPVVMFEGLLIAVGVGLLGGMYPAWRAARLLPTEAVRHE